MNQQIISFETESLVIRQAGLTNAEFIADYFYRNKSFHKPFDPIRPDYFFSEQYWLEAIQADFEKYKNDQSLRFFLYEKLNSEKIIGMIHFSGFIRGVFQACYVGYSLDEHSQGKGYMTQALQESINFMFTQKSFHRIMANCMITNEKSLNVLKRLGFQIEGTAKDYLYINGKWEDHILTALTNSSYQFTQ